METVGPLSCGFIMWGYRKDPELTIKHIKHLHQHIFQSLQPQPQIHVSPLTSLSLPPSLFLLLYFQSLLRVSSCTATWARHFGAVLGASVSPILTHGARLASYQVTIPPLSRCSQTAPRFPLRNYTSTLYLLCGLGNIYSFPCQLWALIS